MKPTRLGITARRSFSKYENYSKASQVYDKFRKCVGLESALRQVNRVSQRLNRPASKLRHLDAGCGSGNYINQFRHHVGSCTGVELNPGMLEKSQAKFANVDNVNVSQGSITDLSHIKDASFDFVTCTQVLHHIPTEGQAAAVSELSRVLAPGGVLWINTMLPRQISAAYWWAEIIPQACSRGGEAYPSLAQFSAWLQEAQAPLIMEEPEFDTDALTIKEHWLDEKGPFDPVWRNCISFWSLATPEELEMGLRWWEQQVSSGKAQSIIARMEKNRDLLGLTTNIIATKPLE